MTDEDKYKLLDRYIAMVCKPGGVKREYSAIYIDSVSKFLKSGCSLNMRGYREYIKNNPELVVKEPLVKNGILNLLSMIGIRRSKKRINEVNPLEKKSVISDKNKESLNDFLHYLQNERDYSKSALQIYYYGMKAFFQYSDTFSFEHAKRFVKTLEVSGMKPATIRLRICSMERYSQFIRKPIKLNHPKSARKLDTDNIPTEEEYTRLLSFLKTKDDLKYYFYVKILATTGARLSEFLQLTWEDIIAGEVELRGKGNKYRRIFFSKSIQQEVKEYIRREKKTGILATSRFGPMADRSLTVLLKDWGDKCGIDRKKMHPHAFRHFFAKMYLKKNKDLMQLADLLGHGNLETTRIYVQKSYEEQKRDFNRNVTW